MTRTQTLERANVNTGKRPKFAVIRFPGSNCDQDAFHVVQDILQCPVEYVWHQEKSLKGFDVVIVPGGFSYGDYLRCGAVARFSNIMDAVVNHANTGKYVFGVCNGFQILCETHLLPGALVRNRDCKFLCEYVHLRVENASTPFTGAYGDGQVIRIPIAHGEGCYIAEPETLNQLEVQNRVLFRYVDAKGNTTEEGNPNGSHNHIAGIANKAFNVIGMMPHPERACDKMLGSKDGLGLFSSLIQSIAIRRP